MLNDPEEVRQVPPTTDVVAFSKEEMEDFEEEQRLWGNLMFKAATHVYPKPGIVSPQLHGILYTTVWYYPFLYLKL